MAIILISFSIRCVEIMIETIRDGQQRVIFQRWRKAQRMRNADPCTSHIMITKLVLAGGRPSWQIGCEAISLTSICILRRWRRIEPAITARIMCWPSKGSDRVRTNAADNHDERHRHKSHTQIIRLSLCDVRIKLSCCAFTSARPLTGSYRHSQRKWQTKIRSIFLPAHSSDKTIINCSHRSVAQYWIEYNINYFDVHDLWL